jgi:hypothetical protein
VTDFHSPLPPDYAFECCHKLPSSVYTVPVSELGCWTPTVEPHPQRKETSLGDAVHVPLRP